MDKELHEMWREINDMIFGGQLKPPHALGWDDTQGEELHAHGAYFRGPRCIIIDKNFQFDPAALEAGSQGEILKYELAYLTLVHEMVHQTLHQRNERDSHGPLFLAEAQRIARLLKQEIPTARNVALWPLDEYLSKIGLK